MSDRTSVKRVETPETMRQRMLAAARCEIKDIEASQSRHSDSFLGACRVYNALVKVGKGQ